MRELVFCLIKVFVRTPNFSYLLRLIFILCQNLCARPGMAFANVRPAFVPAYCIDPLWFSTSRSCLAEPLIAAAGHRWLWLIDSSRTGDKWPSVHCASRRDAKRCRKPPEMWIETASCSEDAYPTAPAISRVVGLLLFHRRQHLLSFSFRPLEQKQKRERIQDER